MKTSKHSSLASIRHFLSLGYNSIFGNSKFLKNKVSLSQNFAPLVLNFSDYPIAHYGLFTFRLRVRAPSGFVLSTLSKFKKFFTKCAKRMKYERELEWTSKSNPILYFNYNFGLQKLLYSNLSHVAFQTRSEVSLDFLDAKPLPRIS